MAEGVLWHLASKALESLSKPALQKAAASSWWSARDDLKELENAITVIQARVRDAERRQKSVNTDAIKQWLRRLTHLLYQADDFFDKIQTLDRENQRIEQSTLSKVGILFSSSDLNYYASYGKLVDEINSIKKELEAIKIEMNGFNFRVCLAEELQLSVELFNSFVNVEEDVIIGTENDKNMTSDELKLSYDSLPPQLKQCFAYCLLFPKDYEFSKVKLIRLWMAQGYIEPENMGVGDHYFSELLRRNFFQSPSYDKRKAEVISCKMNEFVHEFAEHVAGTESMQLGEFFIQDKDERLIHVSVNLPDSESDDVTDEREVPSLLFAARSMRTLLFLRGFTYTISCAIQSSSLERVISEFKSLRVLNLENMGIVMLPDSIAGLKHLRYLDLEGNNINCLPDAIRKLINLQTLNLLNCEYLEELPRDFAELVNLKHLDIEWTSLIDLPSGFGKMTSLQEINGFVVGKGENTGIDSIPALNLRGELRINFKTWHRNAVMEAKRTNLEVNQELKSLSLDFDFDFDEGLIPTPDPAEMDEMLARLKLPPNLKYLDFDGYGGNKMPCRWLDGLCNLVSIKIMWCDNCETLPHLSRLPNLQSLHLERLKILEYVEDGEESHNDDYFPSLEVLELCHLPLLKGWTRALKKDSDPRQLLFSRLLRMKLYDCCKLISMPQAPKLESLKIRNINEELIKSNFKNF